MNCGVCDHRWCWSCGFPLNHWIHSMGNPGCDFLNSFAFGYGTHYSKAFMIFIAIAFFLFGIPVFYAFCAGCGVYALLNCHEGLCRCCNCCRPRDFRSWGCGRKCCAYLMLLILFLSFTLPVGIALGSIGFALLIGPIILVAIFYMTWLFYHWCLRSRTVNSVPTD